MVVDLFSGERCVVGSKWPSVGGIKVEQHFGFRFDFSKRGNFVLGGQFSGRYRFASVCLFDAKKIGSRRDGLYLFGQ